MDQVYRHQRYIYDFTRKYYLFGRDRLIRGLALKPGERVVEVGCGTARNLIAIARRYPKPGSSVWTRRRKCSKRPPKRSAVPGSRAASSWPMAMPRHCHRPCSANRTNFDHAVFSYSLSMIPQWEQALKSASAVLRSDGLIHIVDFGDMTGLGRWGRGILLWWLRRFHVAPRAELLHTLELREGGSLTVLPGRYAFLLTVAPMEFP